MKIKKDLIKLIYLCLYSLFKSIILKILGR